MMFNNFLSGAMIVALAVLSGCGANSGGNDPGGGATITSEQGDCIDARQGGSTSCTASADEPDDEAGEPDDEEDDEPGGFLNTPADDLP